MNRITCSGNTGVIGCLLSILLGVSGYTLPSFSSTFKSTTPSVDSVKLLNYLDAFYINLLPYVSVAGDDALESHLIMCIVTNCQRREVHTIGVSEDARTCRDREGESDGTDDNDEYRDANIDIDGSSTRAQGEVGQERDQSGDADNDSATLSLLFLKLQQWRSLLMRQNRGIMVGTNTNMHTGTSTGSSWSDNSNNARNKIEDNDNVRNESKPSDLQTDQNSGKNSHELSRAVIKSTVRTWLSIAYVHSQVELQDECCTNTPPIPDLSAFFLHLSFLSLPDYSFLPYSFLNSSPCILILLLSPPPSTSLLSSPFLFLFFSVTSPYYFTASFYGLPLFLNSSFHRSVFLSTYSCSSSYS